MPKRIPITAARKLAEEQNCKQVIVLAWDGKITHVVTYGVTKEDCRQAACGGDKMKRTFKWPTELMCAPNVDAQMITPKLLYDTLADMVGFKTLEIDAHNLVEFRNTLYEKLSK